MPRRRDIPDLDDGRAAAIAAVPVDDEIGRRIVEAAAEAMIEQGFGGATTDRIARAARTSKRAIYERFPDRDALFQYVMALLVRFTHPTGRRVFATAVAAKPTFPAAFELFWEHGPAVAVEAIAERLRTEKRRGNLGNIQPKREAHRFVLDCCGPVVLEQLVDQAAVKNQAELQHHVGQAVADFLRRIGY